MDAAIKEIVELDPAKKYAIVFDQKITYSEIRQLNGACEQIGVKGILLTNVRVVALDETVIINPLLDAERIREWEKMLTNGREMLEKLKVVAREYGLQLTE